MTNDDDFANRPPPFMNNASEADEIKRLRDIVTKGLGDSPWELTGIRADTDGNMIGVFSKKQGLADA